MRKIIKNLGYFLLIAVMILAFATCVLGFVTIDKYIVTSGSMEPTIPTGSVAIVNRNSRFDDVNIGDVIIFEYNDMRIIHRVIEIAMIDGQKYLKTKGDANSRDDGFIVTEQNFYGITLCSLEKIGYLLDCKNQIKK